MKFSIAAAILAQQSLPAAKSMEDDLNLPSFRASSSALLHRTRRMEGFLSSSLRAPSAGTAAPLFLAEQLRPSAAFRGRGNVFIGLLKNLQGLHETVACDPNIPRDAAESAMNSVTDVGILSCGPGRYCAESTDSSMGGTCTLIKRDESGSGNEEQSNRVLQDETIIDDLQYACDYAYLIGYDCLCDLDPSTYSGTASCSSPIECSTYPSACNVNSTDCRSDSYSVNILSPGMWETELCVEFTEPYAQTTCYSTTMVDYGKDVQSECSVQFEGQACSSCSAYPILEVYGDGGNETYLSEVCYVFDCSNTVAGSIGNTCDFPVSSMSVYLDTYGCPPCNVCGDNGTMMMPDTNVRILNNTYQCGYIQEVSMMGFFTEASCQYFSTAVDEPCQCTSGAPMDGEEGSPTATPTDSIKEVTDVTLSPTNETSGIVGAPSMSAPETTPTELVCNPCPNGNVVDPDALVVVPGQVDQVSCGELESAGLDGRIPEEVCSTVQNLVAVPCCGKNVEPDNGIDIGDTCNPCGPDKEMTKLSGIVSIPQQGMLTCQQLAIMGRVADGNEDWCVLIRPFVQTPCGCESTDPTSTPTTLEPVATQIPIGLQDSGAVQSSILFGTLCMCFIGSLVLSYV